MSLNRDHQRIKDMLPHRWPFLHVDKITKTSDKSIEGYKNISASDVAFLGHFPQVSIFPGVLIIEALAQLSGVFIISRFDETEPGGVASKIGLLTSVRGFKFIKIVQPGDQLALKSILKGNNGDCFNFAVSASVDGHEVAVGEIQLYLQEREAVM